MAGDPDARLLLKVILGAFIVVGGLTLIRSANVTPRNTAPVAPQPAQANAELGQGDSRGRPMPFEQCLQVIRSTAGELGVAPINIVETGILRMVRFCTNDGSVLVTCSQLDRKMVLTRSPHRDGCD